MQDQYTIILGLNGVATLQTAGLASGASSLDLLVSQHLQAPTAAALKAGERAAY